MKILALFALFCGLAFAQSATLISHGVINSTAAGGGATLTLNTSGCTTHCMIAACVQVYGIINPLLSDGPGNTYNQILDVLEPGGGAHMRLFTTFAPMVSSTHTFTVHGTFVGLGILAYNNIASIDQSPAGASGETGTAFSSAALVPTNANELLVACSGTGSTGVGAVPSTASPLSVVDYVDFVQGSGQGLATAAQVQTTATTVTPTWSYTNSISGMIWGVVGATFYSTGTPGTLSVSTSSLPEGFNGTAYNFCLGASGGVQPYTWSLTSGTYPTGISFNAGTGCFSGTPTQTISATPLAFTVTDSFSNTANSSGLAMTIAATTLSISTATCPNGTQYASYAGCTIAAAGGTSPYTYSWFNYSLAGCVPPGCGTNIASLPPGMALDPTMGIVSSSLIGGEGIYGTQFIATDALGATVKKTINISLAGDNTLGGCTLFPTNSIFHYNISNLPVDTSPAANVLPAGYLNGKFKVLISTTAYSGAIPFVRVAYNQSNVAIAPQQTHSFTSAPYPPYAPLENTSNNSAPNYYYYGDAHALIVQTAGGGNNCHLWESWVSYYTNPGWNVVTDADWDLTSNARGVEGVDAGGFPLTPFLLNYDEVAAAVANPSGAPITHATRFTMPHLLPYFVWPANHYITCCGGCYDSMGNHLADGQISQSSPPATCTSGSGGPAGEFYRLKASVPNPSCAATSPESSVILTAFRNYGIVLVDIGGGVSIMGTPDNRWDNTDLNCLTNLTLADFEPVNVSSVVVTNNSYQATGPSSCTISPSSLPTGIVGVAYSQTLTETACGGGTLTWSVSAGSLPTGLTCSCGTGTTTVISGTPSTVTGSPFAFSINVTDGGSNSATNAYSVTISNPPPSTPLGSTIAGPTTSTMVHQ